MPGQGIAPPQSPTAPGSSVNGEVTAPGVTPIPPVTSKTAEQLFEALGIGVALAVDIGQATTRQRAEQENLDRAAADKQSIEYLSQFKQDLIDGKVPQPDDIDSYTNARATAATDGTSPAFTDQFYRRVAPQMNDLLLRQRDGIVDQQKKDGATLVLQAAPAATSAGDFKRLAGDYARFTGVAPRVAEIAVLTQALEAAARSGDKPKFDMVAGLLGEDAGADRAQWGAHLQVILEGRDRDQRDAAEQAIYDMLDRNVPDEQIIEALDQYKGTLTEPQFSVQIKSSIAARAERRQRETLEALSEAELIQRSSDYASHARALAESGRLFMLENETVQTPDGKEKTLNAEKARDAIADEKYAQIAARNGDNEAATVSEMAAWSARNGVLPEPWRRILNHADLAGSVDEIVPEKGEPQKPPNKELVGAFGLYRLLDAQQPGLLQRLMTDQRSQRFLEFASAIADTPSLSGPPERSLFLASRAMNAPSDLVEHANDLRNRGLDAVVVENIKGLNQTDVKQTVEKRTRLFMLVNRIGEAKALELAEASFRKDHVLIKDWWVPVAGRKDIDEATLRTATEAVAERYAREDRDRHEKPEDREGVAAETLVLVPDGQSGWRLIRTDASLGSDVERIHEPGVALFTTPDLYGLAMEYRFGIAGEAARQEQADFRSGRKKPPTQPLRAAPTSPEAQRQRLRDLERK